LAVTPSGRPSLTPFCLCCPLSPMPSSLFFPPTRVSSPPWVPSSMLLTSPECPLGVLYPSPLPLLLPPIRVSLPPCAEPDISPTTSPARPFVTRKNTGEKLDPVPVWFPPLRVSLPPRVQPDIVPASPCSALFGGEEVPMTLLLPL